MRNPDCRRYRDCLAKAALDSKLFDCVGCLKIDLPKDEGIIETDQDFIPSNLKTLDSTIKSGNDEREEKMKRQCTVKGCDKAEKARGLCETHYRLWRIGDTSIQPLPSKTIGRIKDISIHAGGERKYRKAVVAEVVNAPLPAVIVSPNSEVYRSAAVMFVRAIERKVVDAIKAELEERGA